MVRWLRCALAILIVILWMLSIIILALATIIRDNLSQIVLVTEGTLVGDFYLKIFFPVIFPVLITVSCFLFVIGCLGCFGAFTDSQRLLGWFFFSILITFCVELSAGIWRMVEYDLRYNSSDVFQLKSNVENYGGQKSMVWFVDAWKEVHQKFNCCGVYSFEDWLGVDASLLASCCPKDIAREECVKKEKIRHLNGCGNKLLLYLISSQYMDVVPYLTAITGIVQVIALIVTLKIWLVFCFSPKKQTQIDGKICVSPTLYRHDGKYFAQEQKLMENGCYLTPLKSYKDDRYLEKNDLTRSRREGARHSQQPSLDHPIFLLSERDKERNCNEIDNVQQFKTTRFQPNATASSVNSENVGQYQKLSQSCSSFPPDCTRMYDYTTASQVTDMMERRSAVVSSSQTCSHSRVVGIRSSDVKNHGPSTSHCKLSSTVKITTTSRNNTQHKALCNKKNASAYSNSSTSHGDHSHYDKQRLEQENEERSCDHVLNGKVQTKANLTNCDVSLEMAVHYKTPRISS